MIKNILLISVTALLLSGCFTDKDAEVWTSWVFPDKSNTKRSMELGQFPSLEQCRVASLDKLTALNLSDRGDYKCGLRCGYNEGLKTLICERTAK